jgi:thioredoxin-like negative regulator of GroEL
MTFSSDLLNAPKEFLQLFTAGKQAARDGNRAKAHDLFRQAVAVDPYHEMVWLWLASVVDSDDDRRVCFENILELNPSNQTARRQLQQLEQKALAELMHPSARPKQRSTPRWHKLFRLGLMFLVAAAIFVTAWMVFVA